MKYQCEICKRIYNTENDAKKCESKGIAENLMKSWENEFGVKYINFLDCEESPMSHNILNLGIHDDDFINFHNHNYAMLSGSYSENIPHRLYYVRSEIIGHDRRYYFRYDERPNSNLEMNVFSQGELSQYYLPMIHTQKDMQKLIELNRKYYVRDNKIHFGIRYSDID